ncbi:MAG: allantoinase AllB [Akkermansiaceae bacterium]|jgi:allantoinase|nr:allantoinase AllB [Akkermansiaceae bacterium]
MSDADLIIRGAEIVTPEGLLKVDLAAAEGRIVFLGDASGMTGREEVDAAGQLLFPGCVDVHVHFNDPGRADWEGLDSGSAAMAAGGGTSFADMPLNSHPPVLDRETFVAKRQRAESQSCLDFALWGGLTPDSLPYLDDMADEGAIGFKAFLCPSGIDEFRAADARTLLHGMKRAAARGLIIGVHAEDPDFIAEHQRHHPPPRPGTMRDWFASRPPEAEARAIDLVCELAGESGCAVHIVHVSSPEGLDAAQRGRAAGVDITVETCHHYLLLDEDAGAAIGIPAKCAPPLRPRASVEALWAALESGAIDTLGSDHSPAPPEMKSGEDVFAAWGGIAGCQHGFPLILGRALNRLSWQRIAELSSLAPARRFGLRNKGAIALGMDADFILLDKHSIVIRAEDLRQRHPLSPYLGMKPDWRVAATFLRGFRVGPCTRGKFLRPAQTH